MSSSAWHHHRWTPPWLPPQRFTYGVSYAARLLQLTGRSPWLWGQVRRTLRQGYSPMLVPPLPWKAFDQGGHLTLRAPVMRMRGSTRQLQLLKAADAATTDATSGLERVRRRLCPETFPVCSSPSQPRVAARRLLGNREGLFPACFRARDHSHTVRIRSGIGVQNPVCVPWDDAGVPRAECHGADPLVHQPGDAGSDRSGVGRRRRHGGRPRAPGPGRAATARQALPHPRPERAAAGLCEFLQVLLGLPGCSLLASGWLPCVVWVALAIRVGSVGVCWEGSGWRSGTTCEADRA